MPKFRALTSATAILIATTGAQAAVVWDESVQGDFSNAGNSPSFVAVSSGSNQILGASGDLGAGTDRDYFTITVPAGWQLTALTLMQVTDPESQAFIGIQAGNRVTGFGASTLLGWTHYSTGDRGFNVLPRMGTGAGAIGFTGALPAGSYAFWVQDFDAGASPYGLDLTLAAVPEPSTAAAMLLGLAGLGWVRRRLA